MLISAKTRAALLSVGLFLGACQTIPNVDNIVHIRVDASATIGAIKPLTGVNGAPDMTSIDVPGAFGAIAGGGRAVTDISDYYREARVNLVRTHDSFGAADLDPNDGPLPAPPDPFGAPRDFAHTFDLAVIFPNLEADPNDPRSYNFGPTDRLIAGIQAIGADTMFRVGRSGMNRALPPDPALYAEITRHVVLHYNKGWANGFQNRVHYWEVWNEPDLGRIFWSGAPQQYYALYDHVARAIRAADTDALIGGPAIAMVNEPTPYREGFLDYVRAHDLPLDFFSWHWYAEAGDPYDFVRLGRQMRALLDGDGFSRTLSVLDEWNYGLTERGLPEAIRASFVASSLIYMQDAPIDISAFYRADRGFDANGPTELGHALIANGRILATPVRLRVQGGDTLGRAALAGRTDPGDTIQIWLSNVEIPEDRRAPRDGANMMHVPGLFDMELLPRRTVAYTPHGVYDLEINHLDRGQTYTLQRFRLDERGDMSLAEQRCITGPEVTIATQLAAPAMEFVVLTRGPCR